MPGGQVTEQSAKEARFRLRAELKNEGGLAPHGRRPPSLQMLGLLNGKLQEVFGGDHGKRISLLRWVWGIEQSSKELTFSQVKVMLDWLIDKEASYRAERVLDGAGVNIYVVRAAAWTACHAIIAAYCEERGQMRLL